MLLKQKNQHGRIPRSGGEVYQATSCKPFALAASAPPVAAATTELQEEAAWSGWSRAKRPPSFRGSTAVGAKAAARRGAERGRK
jgi:hypothetical protein